MLSLREKLKSLNQLAANHTQADLPLDLQEELKSEELGSSDLKSRQDFKKEEQRFYSLDFREDEIQWKAKLYQKLINLLDLSLIDSLEKDDVEKQIRQSLSQLMDEESVPLSSAARERVLKQVLDEILGLGPLEPLLKDDTISDILINSHERIFVERFGKLELTDVKFDNVSHLYNIIDRIVSSVGRRIDESSPLVDARLKDGSRVNAIIPPLAVDAPSMSIRKFSIDLLGVEDLIEFGSFPEQVADVLWAITRSRLNVVISGGTGSGKTTLLNVMSSFIPVNERIVTIEDSAELQLKQPHVVRLETRPPNIEGKGEINQRELLKNALRMRPDRIILGEIRDAEALDMLQAMNTGHDGSLTTIHANQPRDALSRIENMVAMTGLNLPISAVRAQMASAINIIIQIARLEDGKRCMTSLTEVNGMEENIITLTDIFKYQRHSVNEDGSINGGLIATGMVPEFLDDLVLRGLNLDRKIFFPDYETESKVGQDA